MIVRIDVHHHTAPQTYWQLKRCQVQLGGLMPDVSDPAGFRPLRFDTLEDSVRHAKKATFAFLEQRRHREMPDQIDWRIYEDDRVFPCPVCQQPLYRKAKLGRFGNTLDLHDWGCPRCKKTVTLNTESFLPTVRESSTCAAPVPLLSHERVIRLPGASGRKHTY